MSEHEEEDSDEEEGYDHHSGRPGRSGYEGASGGTGTGRRQDRERSSSGRRDHSASRERSVSPRSERRSQVSSGPARPAKVTLVKSRKNEGEKLVQKSADNICHCKEVALGLTTGGSDTFISLCGKFKLHLHHFHQISQIFTKNNFVNPPV